MTFALVLVALVASVSNLWLPLRLIKIYFDSIAVQRREPSNISLVCAEIWSVLVLCGGSLHVSAKPLHAWFPRSYEYKVFLTSNEKINSFFIRFLAVPHCVCGLFSALSYPPTHWSICCVDRNPDRPYNSNDNAIHESF